MPKIKDIPKVDRPREKLLKKGANALSKTDLLAILLGSGIKGINVQTLAKTIITKFNKDFLNITIDDLLTVKGIGQAKALQVYSAIALIKRFYQEQNSTDLIINNIQNVLTLAFDIRDKKKEHLICLHLDSRNALIKKETLSIGLLDKSLIHPREIFSSALENKAANIILVHNHPSGDPSPSKQDEKIAKKISKAGKIMGIALLDFVIIAKNGHDSFYQTLKYDNNLDYVADGFQMGLFDLLEIEKPDYKNAIHKVNKHYFQQDKSKNGYFQLQNRRYLGNKHKLLGFIEDIVSQKCGEVKSFCDIFSGTGVVGERFNSKNISVISNDFLSANYTCLQTFLNTKKDLHIEEKIQHLNATPSTKNYFSEHFGNRYFSMENAEKIGAIREEIDNIANNQQEKNNLICSLLYAVDKVANTVGHYDAFRKKMDSTKPINLLIPNIDYSHNSNNKVYQEDANQLIKKISCDVLYIDPPYNSRQYSDAYHLLENLVEWKKPAVVGIGKKMDRNHIKSNYCLKNATRAFSNLINHANCKHILFSYNNTQDSKDGRSNARISDNDILHILSNKGKVDIFERDYKAFTTRKSSSNDNIERVFYCEVKG
ncbi:UPF0758 family protein [uncultured Gammaproteobacteria bacterium]|jgi:adenine-specific DNA-methyltransferase|nr:UPF0758 family protein [uncultured Gammaproteobacteria bacterium]CAC9954039.1 UPF0758 family protein [uncultured Gammaproteobacteria bacterium]